MAITIEVNDDDLEGFNPNAQQRLKVVAEKFVSDMIDEANRIEAGRNTTNDPAEVTSSMVHDAEVLIRHGLAAPRKRWGIRLVKIAAAVFSLAVGVMYDPAKLQQSSNMLLFVLVIAAAIICVTISITAD
jgi:hypothetical protein